MAEYECCTICVNMDDTSTPPKRPRGRPPGTRNSPEARARYKVAALRRSIAAARPIKQWSIPEYNCQAEHLDTFSSLSAAAIAVNGRASNIKRCCDGDAETAYGYIWRYASSAAAEAELANIFPPGNNETWVDLKTGICSYEDGHTHQLSDDEKQIVAMAVEVGPPQTLQIPTYVGRKIISGSCTTE